jgi:hypothetical protein
MPKIRRVYMRMPMEKPILIMIRIPKKATLTRLDSIPKDMESFMSKS